MSMCIYSSFIVRREGLGLENFCFGVSRRIFGIGKKLFFKAIVVVLFQGVCKICSNLVNFASFCLFLGSSNLRDDEVFKKIIQIFVKLPSGLLCVWVDNMKTCVITRFSCRQP